MEKALVSACVKCYNQARYVRAALESAFSQTYEPLEIIIADDASTDDSQSIIERCISEYHAKGGKRRIVFVRNEKNRGNVGNWQVLCEHAKGEILVKFDGDDISLPNRVERIVSNWRHSTKCLVHAASTIDLDGNEIGVFKKDDGCFGAGSAYSRDTFESFGPIERQMAADDEVYLWRARMLGEIVQLDEQLVRYRVGSGFSSIRENFRRRMCDNYVRTLESRKQTMLDVKCLTAEDSEKWDAHAREALCREEAMAVLWSDAPLLSRWKSYLACDHGRFGSKVWFVRIMQLLPRRISDLLLDGLAVLFKKGRG